MVNKVSAPIIKTNEGIDSKLKSVGLSPRGIDSVFISHMDFDHTNGLRLVKDVSDIRCSEEEWTACNKFSLRYVDTWTDVCKVGTFSFEQSGIGPVGRSYDVFNDGAYLQSSFTEHKIPGFTVNNQLANKTLLFVKLAFSAAKKYPKECKEARMDIDRRVTKAITEWRKKSCL